MPASGLLIWHIDDDVSGNTNECYPPSNCASVHYRVSLEQADGAWDLEKNNNRGDSGDPFRSPSYTSFTDGTTPNSRLYDGTTTDVSVTDISTSSATMTATLAIGAPDIGISPTSHNFGSTNIGNTSSAQTFTISNNGNVDLNVGTLSVTGSHSSDFSLSSDTCSGQSVAPAGSCTVDVDFSPTGPNGRSASLSVPSNDPDTPTLTAALSGTGVGPQISIVPTSYYFGNIDVGDTSSAQTFTVTNTGNGDLTIGTISVGGTDAADFGRSSDTCIDQVLAPAASCTLDIDFSPGMPGSRSASLSIPSDDPITPTLNVSLSGFGTLPVVTVLSPNGGEAIASGSQYTIQWGGPATVATYTVKYSTDNGTTWKMIAKGYTGTSIAWNVPTPTKNRKKCLVKVVGKTAGDVKVGADKSDAKFTIEVVRIDDPNGGGPYTSGDPLTVNWTTNATKRPIYKVVLEYTKNGGTTWEKITSFSGGSNPGTYAWTVPSVGKSKSKCKVRVRLKDASGNSLGKDASDGYFTINPL